MTDRTNRPNINPVWSVPEKIIEIICLIILAANIIIIITLWRTIPKNIPIHFNFFGTPDSIGKKSMIIVNPVISGGIYFMLTVLEFFPRFLNYPIEITEKNALYSYSIARQLIIASKAVAVAIFAYITFADIEIAKGVWGGLGHLFIITVIVVLAVIIAFYIIKLIRHKNGDNTNSFQQ